MPRLPNRRPGTLPRSGDEEAEEAARRVVDENSYLTVATVDENGRPWASPVWYAAVGCHEFFWVSRPDTRHSQNISTTPTVGIVIFDSAAPVDGVAAVYVEAVAEEVKADERPAAIAIYSGRSEARGIRAWREIDVSGHAAHRLYRARASQVYVLTEGDQRIPIS